MVLERKLWSSSGEAHLADLFEELLRGALDRAEAVGVPLHELRLEVGVEAQQVVADQHLPVAVLARADADGGDGQPRG